MTNGNRARHDRAIGYQRWSDLLFLHWRLPAEMVAAVLPTGLTVDTWQGEAWVGLVPFRMSGVRPWWSCAVPWLSAFPETNLRTYVRHRGESGVWVFSLEAGNPVAVWIARTRWSLNYYWARMRVERRDRVIDYSSRRHRSSEFVGTEVSAEIPDGSDSPATYHAAPGSLDHFLIERYRLYSLGKQREWFAGNVRHSPYPLQPARVIRCQQNITAAAGLPTVDRAPDHVVFSPGVSVEILPLRPLR
jgi:uncharacterized protein YqjF (DUF2071 family)